MCVRLQFAAPPRTYRFPDLATPVADALNAYSPNCHLFLFFNTVQTTQRSVTPPQSASPQRLRRPASLSPVRASLSPVPIRFSRRLSPAAAQRGATVAPSLCLQDVVGRSGEPILERRRHRSPSQYYISGHLPNDLCHLPLPDKLSCRI